MKAKLVSKGMALFGLTVLPVAANVVYQQASVYVPPNGVAGISWTSVFSNTDGGFQTFDNFSVPNASHVNVVQWEGFYRDDINSANNPVPPSTVTWDLSFSADNSGAPGASLYDIQESAASVSTTKLGTTVRGTDTVFVYQFTATLPTAFSVAANTTYWFSPLSLQPSSDPILVWVQGTGGDGISFQNDLNPGGGIAQSFVRADDRAFTLISTPEPNTAFLLGILLAGILGRHYHRKAARN